MAVLFQGALFAEPPPDTAPPAEPAKEAVVEAPSKPTAVLAEKILIHVPSRTLFVYQNGVIVRRFPVGVGRVGFPTPEGSYKVLRKITHPGWENPYLGQGKMRVAPGKTNPLGTRWIGFLTNEQGEFGIHGTDRPQSVGKFSSHGCVRMQVKDAEVLFEKVAIGTPVLVSYERVWAEIKPVTGEVKLSLYPDWFWRYPKPLTVEEIRTKVASQVKVPVTLNDTKLAMALALQKNEQAFPVVVGSIEASSEAAAEASETDAVLVTDAIK